MTFTAATRAEAEEIATECRAFYAEHDYEVEIVAPLFPGDLYRVNVS